MSTIPRRSNLNEMSKGERAIYDASQAVEGMGAHPWLTDAVVLLDQARDKVADFVDRVEQRSLAPAPDASNRETAGGLALIAIERERQITDEGFGETHDDSHTDGELAAAAAVYAAPYPIKAKSLITGNYEADVWPWNPEDYKPGPRIRELVKAGALIVAEIDRLTRAALDAKDRQHAAKENKR